ncbi:MAG TPA: DNA methyltransferase [Pirellulales bacterium]|nr:DNA methyltransferase [Pirellulales bacterium]
MKPTHETRKLAEIVFDEALYPRREHDPAIVQRYASSIESIEAAGKYISLTHDNRILDGKHRFLGYRVASQDDQERSVPVFVYPEMPEHDAFALAVELNSQHGYQLLERDKKQSAVKLYGFGFSYKTISGMVSVSERELTAWLSDTVKQEKERKDEMILDMHFSCHTQAEIAKATGLAQPTIKEKIDTLSERYQGSNSIKLTFSDEEFETPIYNVWTQNAKSNAVGHFGNTEQRWVENLLYAYTEPFDIVVDPFAGGGATIDVCKKRGRRYFVSDRLPIIAREDEIRKWDIGDGLPELPQWKDVKLVYLDPPYWKQAENQYSSDPEDLANMPLEKFNEALSGLIKAFAKKLKAGSFIALIIQPTQWNAPDRQFTDHVGDMLRAVKLPVDMRISCPYSTQQCTAQMVDWAKENRRCLVLSREIIVWRI